MAQTPHRPNGFWAETAAARKYDVSAEGLPIVGTQLGDTETGLILTVPALDGFEHIPEALRGMVQQAVLEYVQNRIAQPAAKKDKADRNSVQEAINTALRSGFNPSRSREKTLVESEAMRQFEAHVRARVAAVKPDATEGEILSTIAAQADKDTGKAWIAEARKRVIDVGTYAVSKKGKTTGSAVEIAI